MFSFLTTLFLIKSAFIRIFLFWENSFIFILFLSDLKEHSQQKAILRRKTVSVLQSPNLIQNLTESAKVKILPPPPKAFRDTDSEKIKVDIPKVDKIEVDKNKVDKNKERNGKIKRNQHNSLNNQVKELKLEPTASVPMRRKAKDNNLEHSTFSLSR